MFGLLMSFVGLISVFSSLAIIAVACVALKRIFKQSTASTIVKEREPQAKPEIETKSEASIKIGLDGEEHQVEVEQLKAVKDSDEKLDFSNIGEEAKIIVDGEAFDVKIEGMSQPATAATETTEKSEAETLGQARHHIRAPMRGTVVKTPVKAGDKIQAGTTVIVLETMKMENSIQSPVAGTVKFVKVSVGDSVSAEDILVIIE
jgi:biotin carboxyl carrier protein